MADDSPGKVQALRAIFAEKNNPLMGMMPPNGKIANRPWKSSIESTDETIAFKERVINEQNVSSQLITKVLPVPAKKPEHKFQVNGDGLNDKILNNKAVQRPAVGPKPTYLSQNTRTSNSSALNLESTDSCDTKNDENNRTLNDTLGLQQSHDKSKAVAETIASFMFTNGYSHGTSDSVSSSDTGNKTVPTGTKVVPPPIPAPKNSHQTRSNLHADLVSLCNSQNSEKRTTSESDTLCIGSDNYICKSNSNFRRKELPSVEKLGAAPLKPTKPQHMVLPAKYRPAPPAVCPPVPVRNTQPPVTSPPAVPLRPAPQRPTYPCPARPHTPPPLPPMSAPINKPRLSLREEIEELYEDTLLSETKRPVSLIPEFTEEEESEDLYDDAGPAEVSHLPSTPMKPKEPPPPCPSEYLQPNIHSSGSCEELYQDAEDPDQEEFYEEMPCETLADEPESPLYSNNKKEIEKLRKEEEKKLRKEQKEKEKRDKELEKLKRKFGLTGEEIPIDDGLVKADSRGGRGDLPVKRGETVLILRMEGNPSGRWLVKNEKGKIGYVELTNIEVDPLSVKSVMSIRRLSVISTSEDLYNEAKSYSEEEAIYEVTY